MLNDRQGGGASAACAGTCVIGVQSTSQVHVSNLNSLKGVNYKEY